jgi:hypothetical protein
MDMQEEVNEYAEGGRQQNIAAEIMSRHRKSQQPESQQVCAVLGAVQEVVRAEGLEVTPTALFAALMSALENDATRATPEVPHSPSLPPFLTQPHDTTQYTLHTLTHKLCH